MLLKAHLTSHSKMSGSRWVTILSRLSRSLRPFLCSSSVNSGYLFLISSASVSSLPFLSFIVPILAGNVSLDISNFLEEISSLSHSTVHLRRLSYLSLLFSGTLHSVGYIFPFLPCLSFLFFPQLFVKPPWTTTLPSCILFEMVLLLSPVQCNEPLSIVLQALCPPNLIPWICSSPPLYKHKDLI